MPELEWEMTGIARMVAGMEGSHGGREIALRAWDMRACMRIHEILIAVLLLTSPHILLLQPAFIFSVLFHIPSRMGSFFPNLSILWDSMKQLSIDY